MPALKILGGFIHGAYFQWARIPKCEGRFKKRARGTIPNVILINFGLRVVAGMKIGMDRLGFKNNDIGG